MIVKAFFWRITRKEEILLIWDNSTALPEWPLSALNDPNLFSLTSHRGKQASPKEQQLEEVKRSMKEIEDFVKSFKS